jgi:cell division protein FtsL
VSAKHELLDEIESVISSKKHLDFNYFLYVLLLILFVAMFAFPKIYITQQIYYKSREIAKLKIEHETLQEENKLIAASVESIRFKNQILDTMFE